MGTGENNKDMMFLSDSYLIILLLIMESLTIVQPLLRRCWMFVQQPCRTIPSAEETFPSLHCHGNWVITMIRCANLLLSFSASDSFSLVTCSAQLQLRSLQLCGSASVWASVWSVFEWASASSSVFSTFRLNLSFSFSLVSFSTELMVLFPPTLLNPNTFFDDIYIFLWRLKRL